MKCDKFKKQHPAIKKMLKTDIKNTRENETDVE